VPGLERRADADGVAERDFVAPEIPQQLRDIHYRLWLDLAVKRTAEHAGDIAADPDAVGPGSDHDRPETLDRFGDRAIDIGPRKAFRGRGEHRDHFCASCARGLIAPFIRDKHVEFAVSMMDDATQHLIGIHHLRDRFGRHERPDLNGVQPGADQRLDKADAVRDVDRRLFILQAVARADFDDTNGIAHAGLMPLPAPFRRARHPLARYRRPCI
jgi:hypothetical protein